MPLTQATAFEWGPRNATVSQMLQHAEREWIELPHAGRTIIEPGPAQAAMRLRELDDLGFRVPARALGALDEAASLEAVA